MEQNIIINDDNSNSNKFSSVKNPEENIQQNSTKNNNISSPTTKTNSLVNSILKYTWKSLKWSYSSSKKAGKYIIVKSKPVAKNISNGVKSIKNKFSKKNEFVPNDQQVVYNQEQVE